jgi:hypothetical protein
MMKNQDLEIMELKQVNRLAIKDFGEGDITEDAKAEILNILKNYKTLEPPYDMEELSSAIETGFRFSLFEPKSRLIFDPLLSPEFSTFSSYFTLSSHTKNSIVTDQIYMYQRACIHSLIDLVSK